MSIWAIARITILRLGKPHGPILTLLLLINTSNYKTGGGSFLFRPCPSRVARWKLDYIWEAVRLPSSNRINAPVYRGIFLFFRRIHGGRQRRRRRADAAKQREEVEENDITAACRSRGQAASGIYKI